MKKKKTKVRLDVIFLTVMAFGLGVVATWSLVGAASSQGHPVGEIDFSSGSANANLDMGSHRIENADNVFTECSWAKYLYRNWLSNEQDGPITLVDSDCSGIACANGPWIQVKCSSGRLVSGGCECPGGTFSQDYLKESRPQPSDYNWHDIEDPPSNVFNCWCEKSGPTVGRVKATILCCR